jgi:hypothetical protein
MPSKNTLTLPTQNTDGSPVVAGEIVDVQIGFDQTSHATDGADYKFIADDTNFAAETSNGVVTIPYAELNESLAVGKWFCAARVKTSDGVTSAWSNEASFSIAPSVPLPPTNFTIA